MGKLKIVLLVLRKLSLLHYGQKKLIN